MGEYTSFCSTVAQTTLFQSLPTGALQYAPESWTPLSEFERFTSFSCSLVPTQTARPGRSPAAMIWCRRDEFPICPWYVAHTSCCSWRRVSMNLNSNGLGKRKDISRLHADADPVKRVTQPKEHFPPRILYNELTSISSILVIILNIPRYGEGKDRFVAGMRVVTVPISSAGRIPPAQRSGGHRGR
jgi:hypothetical protein